MSDVVLRDPVPSPRPPDRPVRPRLPLVPLVCAVVFLVLVEQVLAHGPVVRLDVAVRDRVLADLPALVLRLSTAVTVVLSPLHSALALLAVGVALAVRRRRPAPLVIAVGTVLALSASVVGLKTAVGRPGPLLSPTGQVVIGYFPSGHTTSALVAAGTITLLLLRRDDARRRTLPYAVSAAVAALIGTSMVLSSFHWVSDVVGAGALGTLLLWLVARVSARVA
jgi:membrane-associated phospholipid phosphatase